MAKTKEEKTTYNREYYSNNREKIAAYQREYRLKIKSYDEIQQAKKERATIAKQKRQEKAEKAEKTLQNRREKAMGYRARIKQRFVDQVNNAEDSYIKRLLRAEGFTKEDIESNPILIETKRIIIKTKRL